MKRGWGASTAFFPEGEQRAPEGISRPIDRTAAPEPQDESMPTVPSSPKARTWWAGCVVHQELPKGAPTAEIKINGRPFKAVLDSGSPSVSSRRKFFPRPTRPRLYCRLPASMEIRGRCPFARVARTRLAGLRCPAEPRHTACQPKRVPPWTASNKEAQPPPRSLGI